MKEFISLESKASKDRKEYMEFGVRWTLTGILALLPASSVALAGPLDSLRLRFLFCNKRLEIFFQ